jgi:mannosyltransferase OCH1-like enzyme
MNEPAEQKIPKILHYVWVGGNPIPPRLAEYMATWKQKCPDYKIIQWDETNFDINKSPRLRAEIEKKHWAFVADIIRTFVLYEHGGIYLDTDVEILKPLDELLRHEFFIGYEAKYWVSNAIIGGVAGHKILKELVDFYSSPKCLEITETMYNVHIYSALIEKLYGIKLDGKTSETDGVALYATDWFYPRHYLSARLRLTENTHTNHHYLSSWHGWKMRVWMRFVKGIYFVFGKRFFHIFERMNAKRFRRKVNKILGL